MKTLCNEVSFRSEELLCLLQELKKKEQSRVSHNHKPQPTPGTKRQRIDKKVTHTR